MATDRIVTAHDVVVAAERAVEKAIAARECVLNLYYRTGGPLKEKHRDLLEEACHFAEGVVDDLYECKRDALAAGLSDDAAILAQAYKRLCLELSAHDLF